MTTPEALLTEAGAERRALGRRLMRQSGSEFAARNPRAVVESLERAARCTWRELQRCRRDLRGFRRRGMGESWFHEYKEQEAKQEAEVLRVLLNIRRGIE